MAVSWHHTSRENPAIIPIFPNRARGIWRTQLTVLDIHAVDGDGAIYNVEMQIAFHKNLLRRMVFYSSELYAAQLKSGEKYELLKPVYSIALIDGKLLRQSDEIHHNFRFMDQKTGLEIEDTIQIHTIEFGKYNELTGSDLAKAAKLGRWIHWFKHAHELEADELFAIFPEKEIRVATEALSAIAEKTEDKQMYDTQVKRRRDLISLFSDAEITGEARGIQKGKIEGKIEGKLEERIRLIHRLQKAVGLTFTPSDKIAEMTEEQVESLLLQIALQKKT